MGKQWSHGCQRHTQLRVHVIMHKNQKQPKTAQGSRFEPPLSISRDAEKTFDKIQYPFMIKTLKRMGIDGKFLKLVELIGNSVSVNITLNGEEVKTFPFQSSIKQCCPLSLLLFNLDTEVLAIESRQKTEIKGIQ